MSPAKQKPWWEQSPSLEHNGVGDGEDRAVEPASAMLWLFAVVLRSSTTTGAADTPAMRQTNAEDCDGDGGDDGSRDASDDDASITTETGRPAAPVLTGALVAVVPLN